MVPSRKDAAIQASSVSTETKRLDSSCGTSALPKLTASVLPSLDISLSQRLTKTFHIGCTYFFIAKLNFNNTDIIFPLLYSISYSNSFTDILYKVKIRSLYFRQGGSNIFEFCISWCWKGQVLLLKISSLKYRESKAC